MESENLEKSRDENFPMVSEFLILLDVISRREEIVCTLLRFEQKFTKVTKNYVE